MSISKERNNDVAKRHPRTAVLRPQGMAPQNAQQPDQDVVQGFGQILTLFPLRGPEVVRERIAPG